MRFLIVLPPVAAALLAVHGLATADDGPPAGTESQHVARQTEPGGELGASLYATQCAGCHGPAGEGVDDRGPELIGEGEAAVDFVLRTGRMPAANTTVQAAPGPVRYDEREIVALVEYVAAFGEGPEIPDVDVEEGDLVAGGELYRLNCAACHVASGAGAAIGAERYAPSLISSTPTEIGEAIIIGPGAMPAFASFTPSDLDDVAAYVTELQDMDTTALDAFGGAGPVAEGLAAWLLGLIPLIAITRWIGTPHEGRDVELAANERSERAGEDENRQ
ncbi:MAG: c-type cytochrome [Actinomycetota bacterium]|nr:c-type cytochrome [Actinomycetota bacterium]